MRNLSTTITWTRYYSKTFWRNTIQKFREAPFGHLTSFLILHELTALIPLPLIYYTLEYFQPTLTLIPKETMESANSKMSKVVEKWGWHVDSHVLLHLATSYAIVKILMPLRMVLCIGMTPSFATSVVLPVQKSSSRIIQKLFRKS